MLRKIKQDCYPFIVWISKVWHQIRGVCVEQIILDEFGKEIHTRSFLYVRWEF